MQNHNVQDAFLHSTSNHVLHTLISWIQRICPSLFKRYKLVAIIMLYYKMKDMAK